MSEHWEPWVVLVVLGVLLTALARSWARPDVLMLGGMTVLATLGLFTPRLPEPNAVVSGFGSEGLITVAVLFVVASALTQTGAMQRITAPLLGRPGTVFAAQSRLMLPVAGLSAFLNNTPIVAMFLPIVSDWAKRARISPSKLFIPLSYASILGGVCTLVGTSTNLVVNGLILEDDPHGGLAMFTISRVGVPCLIVGAVYMLTVGRWLLPDRCAALGDSDDTREYTVEMMVDPGSPLIGQSIEQAGLRQLPGLYLLEIERRGELLPAVSATQKLEEHDRLVFVGAVESVVDLRKMRGLSAATDQVFKLDTPAIGRTLVEAVVSPSCPLVGRSIREGRFRSVYGAAVIAVGRDGHRLPGKLGDVVLQPGDNLLLEAGHDFAPQQRNSRDFYLVSKLDDSAPMRHHRAWPAVVILIAMIAVVTLGWVSMMVAALWAAGLMWLTRCITATEARRSVDWEVLVVIGAAIGIGKSVVDSGLAASVAGSLVSVLGQHPWLALGVVYLVTTLFTELVTNNAAAVLMYPIAKATALAQGVDPMPFVIVLMIAASASFATPIGYQTNLMVYGPGGYRFADYLRVGLPLNFLIATVAVGLTPWFFPFHP